MKQKLFVVSDIHSHFSIFKRELDKCGFDINNESHWLIVCGDLLDRGDEPQEILNFVMNLPRKILIKGNHEILITELINRGFPHSYDWHNGTAETVIDLAPEAETFIEACNAAHNRIEEYLANTVDYFETKNYIFVHAFIPLIKHKKIGYTDYEFRPDWRQATKDEWDDARWYNPFDLSNRGFLPDKTLVFGHWHCSSGHYLDGTASKEFGSEADFSIYYGKGYIAIDACTAYSQKVNILVVEDEFI